MVVPPDNLEQLIADVTMAPYIVKATALIGVKRRAGSNMFRHQIATMGILIDYKIADPILLKASVIHDLFEDALGLPGVTRDEITSLDSDGPAVYDLVMEVTRRRIKGVPEPKAEFLLRVMQTASMRARTLKLVDRISNLTALGYAHEVPYIRRQVAETREYILPYAEQVNPDMFRELSDLVSSREHLLTLIAEPVIES